MSKLSRSRSGISFQFTRPRGARPLGAIAKDAYIAVSIHAPAGGATSSAPSVRIPLSSFNSRARGGRDDFDALREIKSYGFNSRARGGRDSCFVEK